MQTGNLPKIKGPKAAPTEPNTMNTVQTQYDNLTQRLEAVGAPTDDRGAFGRFMNLEQDQGPLMDFFELWDRPGQAIKGAIVGAQKTNPFSGFYEGLTGKSDQTGLDFQVAMGLTTEQEIESMTGVEKFARNVLTDIITDPLTYLPAGTITGGIGKLNRKIGGMISGSSGIGKASKEITEGFIAKQLMLVSDDFSRAIDDVVLATGKSADDAALEVLENFKKSGKVLDDGDEFLDKILVKNDAGDLIPTSREDYVNGLKAQYDKLTKAQKVEVDGFNKMYDKINEMFGNNPRIKTIINKVSDRAEDIAVYYRVGKEGSERWVRIFNIDGKVLNGSFGKTFMMGGLDETGDLLEFAFGSRSTLNETSRGLVDQFLNIKTGANETVGEIVQKIYQGQMPKGYKGINFKRDFPEQFDKLKELFRGIIKSQGLDYYYVGNAKGGKFLKVDDVLDSVDFEKSVAGWLSSKGKKQFRFDINPGKIDLDKYTDALDDMMKQLASVDGVLDEKAVRAVRQEVGILTALSEADTIFKKPAQLVKETLDSVGRLFNWKLGLTDDYANLINRMGAQDAVIINQKGRRLVALSEEAVRRNPDAEKIIQELMDLGAEITEINGVRQVLIPDNTRTGQEIFGLLMERMKNGDDFLNVPIYSTAPNASKNLLFQMNDAVERTLGVTDAFRFKEKGGQFFLELDQLDYNSFNKLYSTGQLNTVQLNLGRKQLDQNYLDFFTQNEKLVTDYIDLQNDIIKTFEDVLGPNNIPDFLKTTNGYTRHKLSKQGVDYLKSQQPLARSGFIKNGVDLMQTRNYLGTAEDINTGLKAWYNIDIDVMDTNITNSMADLLRVGVIKNQSGTVMRTMLNQADAAGKPLFTVVDNTIGASLGDGYKYIDDFNGAFGNITKNMSPADTKLLNDYLAKHGFKGGGKSAIAMNKSAYGIMKKIDNAYIDIPDWLKNYDKVIGGWKGLTLITPGFHMNNYVGNMMNSYLVGMGVADQGIYTQRALLNMRKYDDLMKRVSDIATPGEAIEQTMRRLDAGDREIFESLYNYYADGVSMKFSGVRDIKPMVKTLEGGGQKNLYDKLIEANFNLSENADDLQRYALYQWGFDTELAKLRKAGELSEEAMKIKARNAASNTVFNSLFDYRNYTRFEQDVVKRLVPFYTFMKNNVVFQTMNILRNPGQYAKVGRAYNYYIDDIAGIGDNDMPDYARDNMWLPLPMTVNQGDKQMISFLRTNMPLAEYMEFVENPFKRGATSLAFPIKIPLELGAGVDLFTGQKLREFPGEQSRLGSEEGVLPFLRDAKGNFALSGDPIAQKIMNDLGLRVPQRYLTLALDMADATMGYQDPATTFLDALERFGVANTKDLSNVQLTNLYQLLEERRIDRKQWEQETGKKLPTLDELGLR
jgi:hypothetical protein